MPFARSLRHALRLFRQVNNALQEALANSPNTANVVTNFNRVTTLLHITLAFLWSSDRRYNDYSRQGRYNDYKENPGKPYRLAGRVCGKKPTPITRG